MKIFLSVILFLNFCVTSFSQPGDFDPCSTISYSHYVKSLLEANTLSVDEWCGVVDTLISASGIYLTSDGHPTNQCDELISIEETGDVANLKDSASIDGPNISNVYWAIFSASEMALKYSLAWNYLELAHKVELPRLTESPLYNLKERREHKQHLIDSFKPGFWPPPELHIGSPSTLPVFIVGFFRSGSTLLETMLDAHPAIWGMGEDSIAARAIHDLQSRFYEHQNQNQNQNQNRNDLGKRVVEDVMQEQFDGIVNGVATGILRNMTEAYKKHYQRDRDGSPLSNRRSPRISKIVDKMLANYKNIAFLHLLFPNAVIIHTVRDPLDTLLSCYRIKFDAPGAVWSLSFESLVEEYVSYLEIMQHFRRVLPGRVIDVSYEALVSHPEKVMKHLLSRLNLPWDHRVLSPQDNNRKVLTASALQVKRKIYLDSVGGWRWYGQQLQPLISLLKVQLADVVIRQQFMDITCGNDANEDCSSEDAIVKTLLPSISFPMQQLSSSASSILMNWDFNPSFDYGVMLNSIRNELDGIDDPVDRGVSGENHSNKNDNVEDALFNRYLNLDVSSAEHSTMQRHLASMEQSQVLKLLLYYNGLLKIEPFRDFAEDQFGILEELVNVEQKDVAQACALKDEELLHAASRVIVTPDTIGSALLQAALWLRRCELLCRLGLFEDAIGSCDSALTALVFPGIRINEFTVSNLVQIGNIWRKGSKCEHDRSDGSIGQCDFKADDAKVDAGAGSDSEVYSCCNWHRWSNTGVSHILHSKLAALQGLSGFGEDSLVSVGILSDLLFLEPSNMNNPYHFVLAANSWQPDLPAPVWRNISASLVDIIKALPGSNKYFADKTKSSKKTKASKSDASRTDINKLPKIEIQFDYRNKAIFWAAQMAATLSKNYPLAWKFIEVAVSLERQHQNESSALFRSYNHKEQVARAKHIMSLYKTGFWPTKSDLIGATKPSPNPIFFIGFPNSGVPYVTDFLSHHSKVASLNQQGLLTHAYLQLEKEIAAQMNASLTSTSMRNKKAAVDWLADTVEAYAEKMLRNFRKNTGKSALKFLMDEQGGGSTPKQQLPPNVIDAFVGNHHYIGLIHLLFPNAPIIHVYRDPMDVLFDCYRDPLFYETSPWKFSLESLGMEYILYLELMQHYRRQLPGRIIDVSYESLIANPKATMKAIYSAAKLKIQPTSDSEWTRLTKKKSSIGSWVPFGENLKALKTLMAKFFPGLAEVDGLPTVSSHFDISDAVSAMSKKHTDKKKQKTSAQRLKSRFDLNWDMDVGYNYTFLLEELAS